MLPVGGAQLLRQASTLPAEDQHTALGIGHLPVGVFGLGGEEEGLAQLRQGFLEGSNVDAATELVRLIKTQRAFELNSQSIQAADEALRTLGNLRRF